jgi:hypothetical protein
LPDCWLSFYRFLSAPLRVTATTKTRTNKALQSKSESWCGSGRNALDVAHLSHNAKNRLEPPWADARRLCPPGGRGPLLKKRISPQPLPIRGTPFGRAPRGTLPAQSKRLLGRLHVQESARLAFDPPQDAFELLTIKRSWGLDALFQASKLLRLKAIFLATSPCVSLRSSRAALIRRGRRAHRSPTSNYSASVWQRSTPPTDASGLRDLKANSQPS